MPLRDLLVNDTVVNDNDPVYRCTLGIFHEEHPLVPYKNIWYAGLLIMKKYYIYFDATPQLVENTPYLNVGIGKINPTDTISSHYKA